MKMDLTIMANSPMHIKMKFRNHRRTEEGGKGTAPQKSDFGEGLSPPKFAETLCILEINPF